MDVGSIRTFFIKPFWSRLWSELRLSMHISSVHPQDMYVFFNMYLLHTTCCVDGWLDIEMCLANPYNFLESSGHHFNIGHCLNYYCTWSARAQQMNLLIL